MKKQNSNLHKAKKAKDDEFYTQLGDIEFQMKNFKKDFKDKIIFLNCDDPEWSNFWKYFSLNFDYLGLKKLISTHYSEGNQSYKMEMVKMKDNQPEYIKTDLKGDGDFRSEESIELLKEADFVITNPPFSLFREYVAQLIEYNKKFLIIGNHNAITYKEIYTLIKENKIWLSYRFNKGNAYFKTTKTVNDFKKGVFDEKTGLVKMRNVSWFSNLETKQRNEEFLLFREYNEQDYDKYDNFNAIEVGTLNDIPKDYEGVMGVPITFLQNYNPKQFRIIGFRKGDNGKDLCVNGKDKYFRILIQKINKKGSK